MLFVLYAIGCEVKQKNQVEFVKKGKVVAFGACPCLGNNVCVPEDDSVQLDGKASQNRVETADYNYNCVCIPVVRKNSIV